VGINAAGKAYGRFIATGLRPGFLDRLKSSGVDLSASIFERQVLAADETE
jgi:pilus assembly protein CpaF